MNEGRALLEYAFICDHCGLMVKSEDEDLLLAEFERHHQAIHPECPANEVDAVYVEDLPALSGPNPNIIH